MHHGGSTLMGIMLAVSTVVALGGIPSLAAATASQQVGVTADIDYTCRNVTVSVEPKWVPYDIVIYYEDRVTGRQGKALVGPMHGRTVEPYGDGILFTSVEVMVNGATIETETILARCYPDTNAATRSGRSAIATASGGSVSGERSRNPVPVAMATTRSSRPISPAEER